MSLQVLTQELMRHLANSHVLKDEIAHYKRECPNSDEWQWDNVARIVTQKIRDMEIKARADNQLGQAGLGIDGGYKMWKRWRKR